MRFRLGNTGAQSVSDGFGKGLDSLFSMPLMEAQAAEQYQNGEAKRALTASQMAAHAAQTREADAHAALFGQQATDLRAQQDRGSIGELVKTAALSSGIPLSQVDDFTRYAQTGQLPALYDKPADGMGPSVPEPAYTDPQLGARIWQNLGLTRQALTMGDKDVAHIADATGKYQQQEAVRTVQADPSRAGVVGQSFAAAHGQKLIDNIGDTGRGFNMFTGEGNTLSPGVAALYDQNQASQVAQHNASAGASQASAASSYASAAHSRASTDKVREEIVQLRNAPKGVLVQTDAGPVFADPRTGAAVPVRNPDGSVAAPKLKDVPPAQNHAFIENAKAIDNIDAAMKAITQSTGIRLDENGNPVRDANVKPTAPNALGGRNFVGDAIRQRTDPNGVPVRALVANIGSQKFHDLSGAAVTASESPRLTPFIPQATDGPGAALQKLANLRREAQNVNEMLQQTYSRDQGFRGSPGARPSIAIIPAPAPAAAPASGWTIERVN